MSKDSLPLPDVLRVAWYGSPPPRQLVDKPGMAVDAGDVAELTAGTGPLLTTPPRVAVLDAAGFHDLETLRSSYHRLSCPVLVLAPAESAEGVLRWLRPADDVALSEAPVPLLLHRIRQVDCGRERALDSLTGLSRRQQLIDALDRLLPLASEAHPLALLFVDVDHFKRLNDRHGHLVGDQVLRELGAIVGAGTPQAEEVARYGGELFALVLSAGEERAHIVSERLRRAVAAHTFPEGTEVTVSVGISTTDVPMEREALLQQAQEAVYAAKAAGRDRVMSYRDHERSAAARDEDVALASFENLTRVVSQRIVEMLTWRGRKLFETLRDQAENDGLTGLHARRYLDRRLAHEVDVAGTGDMQLTIALLDLDFFGRVNKEHGWPSGDKVLRELATLLTKNVRGSDWLARYGGEEFCLVMPDTALPVAERVVERLRRSVEEFAFTATSDAPIPLTISAGVAELKNGEESLADLLERVSERLLVAKNSGRNRVAA